MRNFKTFDLAVEFYRLSRTLSLPKALKEQLNRAASSIVLNLAEGRGRPSTRDQIRFFNIAMGSLRESQAILTLGDYEDSLAWKKLDSVGAALFRLIERAG